MKNRITRITAALAAAALLAGCGSISSKDGGYYTTEAAAQESYNYDSVAGGTDSSLMPANAAEAATDETAQKIIYNASLSMESTDFDAARETLMAAVEANNAWMESTSVYGTEKDHDRSADYTVRVPVDNSARFWPPLARQAACAMSARTPRTSQAATLMFRRGLPRWRPSAPA